jgi:hypothetical protein
MFSLGGLKREVVGLVLRDCVHFSAEIAYFHSVECMRATRWDFAGFLRGQMEIHRGEMFRADSPCAPGFSWECGLRWVWWVSMSFLLAAR